MRYLAIDLGDKRTGLATGDDVTRIATPAGIIETSKPQLRLSMIERAVKQEQPGALVVGLPLNMDGSEGPAAKKSRQLAGELAAHTGLPVHLADERLTSEAADQILRETGMTRKARKSRQDAVAAAAILNRFFYRNDA